VGIVGIAGIAGQPQIRMDRFMTRIHEGEYMIGADRLTRGILIGGSLGAFSVIFGYNESMFLSIGVGMIAGALAGITMAYIDKRKKKK
jgi:mannitol-specific phosphotransferase system IIBC component